MSHAVKGDSHIGLSTGTLSRTEEIDRIYGDIVTECIRRKVGTLFDLGDVFHTNRPSTDIISKILKHVDRLQKAGIEVRVVEGNHEKVYRKGRRGALEVLSSSGYANLQVFDQIASEEFEDFFAIYVPWLSPMDFGGVEEREGALIGGIIQELEEAPDALPIVVFAHANVEGATVGKNTLYTPKEFVLPDFLLDPRKAKETGTRLPDLIFCGHIHKTQIVNKKPPLIVLGTPQYNSFAELGNEKVFALFDPTQLKRSRA